MSVHHGSSSCHKRAFLDAYAVDVFFGRSMQQGALAHPQVSLFMQESKRSSPENSGGGRVSRAGGGAHVSMVMLQSLPEWAESGRF